ncbi:hypothetical protein J1N35_028898 [Gossypium stocksii]|uniref:Reverse transcriptase domain-containing protein n=1 Tax=Gossypium stocksii TaxID=47602 RepID=A0A9D3UX32_9ROSI|nr:hypothetical protein J1N35_028898 [Gossypium stocksii]
MNWMAINIDLEKAYDRISWEFIDVSLQVAGINDFLHNVIMSAIMGSSIQVLWNGVQTQKFKSGSSNEMRKLALVSWKSICQPRSCGGLGLRQMRNKKTSFKFKLGFKLASNSSTLWVRIPNESITGSVSITPLHASTEPDKIEWMGTPTSLFSLKNAYWKLSKRSWDSKYVAWNIQWKCNGP